jgi:hypothetical protein
MDDLGVGAAWVQGLRTAAQPMQVPQQLYMKLTLVTVREPCFQLAVFPGTSLSFG